MNMRRILVTGGAGFIGSNIAGYFADNSQYNIAVSDHFGSNEKWRNLAKHQIFEIVSPTEQFYWLEDHKDDLEAVIHMGAVSSTTETNVDFILEHNFSFAKALWDWCRENEVRFIYASSAATFGAGEAGFEDGADLDYLRSLRPMNAYGWSKQLFDQFVALTVARGGKTPPQWAGLKFFNVYGPNEYHKGRMASVIMHTARQIKATGAMKLFRSHRPDFEDGAQSRDFIYVKDVVDILQFFFEKRPPNAIYNLGTGKARTFLDLAKGTFHALGLEPIISFVDTPADIRDTYQYFTEADMTKMRAAGYLEPFYGLEEGITDYVQRYLKEESIW
jgi:ADP-L-glycero-D-manno-heptose 6-epimerase